MIINLNRYGSEVQAAVDAFGPFVEHASVAHLKRVWSDLEQGREDTTAFVWETPVAIKTKPTTDYDGRGGRDNRPVYATWSFIAKFALEKPKAKLWRIERMETHIEIYTEEQSEKAFHFHFDLKQKNQRGPHTHMQVNEDFLSKAGGIKLAVPRFPSAALLPTDCMDLVLCEFFASSWPEEQATAHKISAIRQGQLHRAKSLADAIHDHWRAVRGLTPFTALQDFHVPDLQLA